jgi:hypothetical protein
MLYIIAVVGIITTMMNKKGNEMDYGMFSVEGNAKVASIVAWHIAGKDITSPKLVLQNLEDLAKYDEKFAEATDTAVREIVLEAVFPELFV